jgi:GTP-binding protein EngB required for normal cell division
MHIKKQNFLSYLSAVERVLQNSEATGLELNIDLKPIKELEASIRSKELLVPVVGAFSAGKSSLLNAILGKDVLSVAITPETAIPTELRHDSRERQVLFTDGRTEEFRVEELPQLQARAKELDCVRLYLNSPALNALAPLVLVDMPGFNSPLDAHNKAIARYIGEGAHYLFVVSIEEGTLQNAILTQIDQIAHMGRSFSVCINKADLRTPSDVEAVCAHIAQRLEDEGLDTKVRGVSQANTTSVQAMLSDIDPEALFSNLFQPALQQEHRALSGVLKTAQDGLQRDKADNEKYLEEMGEALRLLQQEQQKNNKVLRGTDLEAHTNDILHGVRNRLERSIDSMAQAVLRGSQDELGRIVSDEVRSGLIEGARRATDSMSSQMVADFSMRAASSLRPEVRLSQDWTDGLLGKLQSELLPALLSSWGSSTTFRMGCGTSTIKGGSNALGAAAVIGTLVPHPILKVVLSALPLLLDTIFGRVSEGQKLEKIKDALRTQALPDIERRLRPEVGAFLLAAQEQTLTLVASSFDSQIKQQMDALAQATQDMAAGGKDTLIAMLQNTQSELNALAEAHLR